MHGVEVRSEAMRLCHLGLTLSEVSRRTGVSRSTLREWSRTGGRPRRPRDCPRCDDVPLDHAAYACLLGYYLGDGCPSAHRRCYALRVACDAGLPGIVDDVVSTIELVRPGTRVFHVRATGAVQVTALWKHWPCLFPQHGPGRKHERPIVLEQWQCEVVEAHPGPFLRGLFHSDGSRVRNWATRPVAGVVRRHEYPRWQFSNVSEDILGLCTWALDLVDVAWRRSAWNCVSVSRREAVAALDDLIGPKR